MLIVYTGTSNEIIVTTPELEPDMLKEYFAKDMGRDLEGYDRKVISRESAVTFSAETKMDY